MCQFCVEHGEGERWYLQAKNYSFDLESDARRRGYILDFVRDFRRTRANAIAFNEAVGVMPAPIAKAARGLVTRRMKPHHFGQPVTIEDCEGIFDVATSITVIPCICRMHTPGKRAEEVCVLVTTQPIEPLLAEAFSNYQNGPDLDDFHRVGKAEALEMLRECEQQGLMHSVWTFQTPFTAAICNCNLESGCMAMKLTEGYKMKLMWRGESVALFDPQLCSGCGACAKLCPFSAIEMQRGVAAQSVERCWGCGICRAKCRKGAITMVDRREVPAVANMW